MEAPGLHEMIRATVQAARAKPQTRSALSVDVPLQICVFRCLGRWMSRRADSIHERPFFARPHAGRKPSMNEGNSIQVQILVLQMVLKVSEFIVGFLLPTFGTRHL